MKNLSFFLFFIFLSNFCLARDSITVSDIRSAEKIISLHFTEAKEDSLLGSVQARAKVYDKMHRLSLDNSIPMTMTESPLLPYMDLNKQQLPVKFFIGRLKKYGDTLQCVISLTEDIAMKQAKQADKEIAEGKYRGLLQGIPYGIKDLFAVRGTKTTWGAAPYKNQVIDKDSYVYTKLKEAGAVLIAKLSLGALAMDDYWFGGRTKNPWNMLKGSSGSSAGSAAATVAGLVPFAIGTETYG